MRESTKDSLEFGQRLRDAINQSPLSKREFCEESNTSLGALHGYESGEIFPSLFKVLSFAEVLKVDFNWLCTGKGSMFASSQAGYSINDKLIAETLSNLSDVLSENEKTWEQKARIFTKYYAYLLESQNNEQASISQAIG